MIQFDEHKMGWNHQPVMLGLLPNLQILRCVAERDSSSLSRYDGSAVFSAFGIQSQARWWFLWCLTSLNLFWKKSLVCWLVCTYFRKMVGQLTPFEELSISDGLKAPTRRSNAPKSSSMCLCTCKIMNTSFWVYTIFHLFPILQCTTYLSKLCIVLASTATCASFKPLSFLA